MPITLPALNRRRWMQLALAPLVPGLSEAASPRLSQPGAELWALLSDTHIAAERGLSARGVVMADNLERCLKQILSLGQKPFGALINGDCAYLDGQTGDYETFVKLLEPLRESAVAVHCTLGNHDQRKSFMAAMTSPQDARPLEGKHVSVVSSATMNWILLDSLETVNATPGRLGETQLGWLDRTLASCPARPTVVMAHHNPPPADSKSEKHSGLTDSTSLFKVLANHSKVKAFIFGHTHQWAMRRDPVTQMALVNLPPTAYVFNPSSPSGWVLAAASQAGLQLELRCLNPNHPMHGEVFEIPWS
jgi:3',5'-cyclic AMP phosphodiesterase CpdA